MPVDLTIVESTTELGQTVVEVVLDSSSAPGVAGVGVPTGGTTGQRLAKASDTDFDTEWADAGTPGLHASSHEDGGADEISLTGLSGTPAALTTHEADTTAVHGIADTSALALTANHPSNATFNDHSARHENGGADEISLAGLDGTPTDLQTHLDDATAAHAATAISFTPDGSIAATTVQAAIVEVRDEAGGGGAPTDVDYLVGTASGGLSAEIVVGTAPGGELGGTWASPTVDATHSGSTHAAVQAAAEATAAAALSAHLTDTSDAHDASAISVDSTTLSGTGTDVQASLEELDNLLDDHSARHENGGADEINIGGLDGTPTELTNHLNDAADAHDASAISVLDSGANYTATDVEGVLAEIAPQLGGGTPAAEDVTVADAGGFLTATDVEAALQEILAQMFTVTSYVPALTAVTTNPTLGTGSSATGNYMRIGDFVVAWGRIVFGSSGVAAGVGNYRVSLPLTADVAASQVDFIGTAYITDSGTSTNARVCIPLVIDTEETYFYMEPNGTSAFVAHNSPFTWAASDGISWFIAYRVP